MRSGKLSIHIVTSFLQRTIDVSGKLGGRPAGLRLAPRRQARLHHFDRRPADLDARFVLSGMLDIS